MIQIYHCDNYSFIVAVTHNDAYPLIVLRNSFQRIGRTRFCLWDHSFVIDAAIGKYIFHLVFINLSAIHSAFRMSCEFDFIVTKRFFHDDLCVFWLFLPNRKYKISRIANTTNVMGPLFCTSGFICGQTISWLANSNWNQFSYNEPVLPPSTGTLIPVIYAAAGEARKATALATSEASANRCIGISRSISCSISCFEIPVLQICFDDTLQSGCHRCSRKNIVHRNFERSHFIGERLWPVGDCSASCIWNPKDFSRELLPK